MRAKYNDTVWDYFLAVDDVLCIRIWDWILTKVGQLYKMYK